MFGDCPLMVVTGDFAHWDYHAGFCPLKYYCDLGFVLCLGTAFITVGRSLKVANR